ncbi:MAG: phosphotransacetylase, partial [Methanoregulaceae archaeon]|nr:phosphotransacetylase [Methanoregulaceae archaeon]
MTRIGIGLGQDLAKILSSIEKPPAGTDLVVYTGQEFVIGGDTQVVRDSDPPGALVRDLVEGRIDAAVRGTLPANETLSALRRATGVPQLERIALLETAGGIRFLLAPVGV